MKHTAPELQPPTMTEFKDFVRRIVSVPKRDVEQKLAEQRRERATRRKAHHR